jgi:dolichyl-phosphate-mannose--protein O-mannosyl transferase
MKKEKISIKKLFLPILIVLMVWGILLRSPEIISGNYLFGHDHGRDYLAAYNIAVNHKLTLIGAEAGSGVAGINGIFHGPGYFYLIALAYALFQGNPIGAQVFMLLFGIAALIAAAWTGYKMFGRVGSVLFLFFVAVSPLIVSQSRFIWSSHPITVFILLALYFVYKIPDNPKIYAPLSVFIAGFTYNSQLGVSVPLTVSILFSIIFV